MSLSNRLKNVKIATRVWVILSVIYLLSVCLLILFLFKGFREDTLKSAASEMSHRLEMAKQGQLQRLEEAQRHVLILSEAPQVLAFNAQVGANKERDDSLTQSVLELFEAMMRTYPEYFQIRLLAYSNGDELLRVNRVQDTLQVVPFFELQNKGEREYFLATSKLNVDQHFVSVFDLNREHGSLSRPYLKTLRVAKQIAPPLDSVKTILVINVDASCWLGDMESIRQERNELFLVDARGDFLYHPVDSLTFASLKADSALFHAAHDSELTQIWKGKRADNNYVKLGDNRIAVTLPFEYGLNPVHELRFIMTADEDLLLDAGKRKAYMTSLLALFALLVGIYFLRMLAKYVVRPIEELAHQVHDYRPGGDIPSFAVERKDEFGGLAVSFQKLTARINLQIKELLSAKQKAEESEEAKEAFLGNFSHELRTPLNSISGMTEVLARTELSEEQKPLIETLRYSVDNLSALLGDVLDQNRIISGELQLHPSAVVLEEIARNSCLSHKSLASRRGVQLNYELAAGIPEAVLIDKLRLLQIINNLLVNALKFTEKGKVNLLIDWKDENLIVSVEDTGVGIRQDELSEIFKRYRQTESGKRTRAGLGLGLAIVQELVNLLGGEIKVESELGIGSCFTARLPAPKQTLGTSKLHVSTPLSLKVLYIDDIEVNRLTMTHLLTNTGVQLLCAAECHEGLKLLMEAEPDVLLMDLRMPEVDGFECIQKVRELKKEVPIIAVSADLGQQELDRLVAMGVYQSIEKPIDRERLISLIKQYDKEGTQKTKEELLKDYCGDDEEVLQEILYKMNELFEENSVFLRGLKLDSMTDHHIHELLEEVSHKLKPSIAMLGQSEQCEKIGSEHTDQLTGLQAQVDHILGILRA
jgi:signal transduction histidine kinase/CheY-like chemotaxis protein